MTAVEIGALSANEIKEKECMGNNVWQVAQEVASMVHDEPGPAGDFVKCYVTTCKKKSLLFHQTLSDAIHRQMPRDARSQVVNSRRYIRLLTFTFKSERCFLNSRRACEISSVKLCDFCK